MDLSKRIIWAIGCVAMLGVTGCSKPTSDITIISNVQGYSFDNNRQLIEFNSMAMAEGKVLATGDALKDSYANAKIIDGRGKTLIPALTDAHGHVSSLGYTLLSIDVRGYESAERISQAIGKYADKQPQLSWIRGRGWNQVLWADQQYPTAATLDAVVADRPVWLERIDGHAGWANSAALKLADITRETQDPPGGQIFRDSQGNPSGILIDNAMNLVASVIPAPGPTEINAALQKASDQLLSLGIVSAHDAGISALEHSEYRQLADSGQMRIRIYAMLSSTDPQLSQIISKGESADAEDMYIMRSVKVYADGALGSRGAAMIEPYSDQPNHNGLMLTSKEELEPLVEQVLGAGFQVNIHAIGDLGNRVALDTFEKAFTHVGGRELRNRIEHSQVVAIEDIPRFKTLDIIPSMQPTHATSDMNMAEDRVGPARLGGAYAWRTFLNQGSIVASGSDFPVELANPFHGLHAAVTRQDHNNQPEAGWIAKEAMTVEEALRSFTIDAAWAANQDRTLGGLSAGKWADFILLDQNIMEIDPQQIWKTKVEQTWRAGELMYSR